MNAKASSKKKEKKQGKDLEEQIQQSFVTIISKFIVANLKWIGIGALVIVVVGASIIGWLSYKKSINEKALVLENEARELHESISVEGTTSDSETPVKSYQDVLNIHQQIIEKYPGTKSAERALYLSGSLEYNQGNYEKAHEHFKAYIRKYPKGKLRFQAEEDIGYIFEQQGEYQKAIEQFKSIEAKVSSSKKSQLLLAIGRNYESLEQFDNAVEAYQSIIDANTSVSWKDMARERLEILQAGVISPPEEPKEDGEEEENNS